VSRSARCGISRPEPDGSGKDFEVSAQSDQQKRIACADIMPGCPFTASAPNEEELMAQVAVHAAREHGITEVTPELAAKVKAAIKTG
jgi:predicted small metal-binding protein